MGDRFVSIPSERLLRELREIGAAVEAKHGGYREECSGDETVAILVPPGGRVLVKIYTSITDGSAKARACGEDAIRIALVAPTPEGDRAIAPSRKVLRTAPTKVGEIERVEAFVTRLRGYLRAAYLDALNAPRCPECGRVMAKRTGSRGAFFGCIGFPACRVTRAA